MKIQKKYMIGYTQQWKNTKHKSKNMKLDEAKQILKQNGYLLEDTETYDDEFEELEGGEKFASNSKFRRWLDIATSHDDLKTKIANAKRFNQKGNISIDDIADWLVNATEIEENEFKVINDNQIYIKPLFKGDGSIIITLDIDNDKIIIKHQHASPVKVKGLSLDSLEDAWTKMAKEAY